MKYRWKTGFAGVDAQAAGEHLQRLRAVANGPLTPQMVVNDARPEDSPLHPAFEWDDAVAAEAHRQRQARSLMANLIVVLNQEHGIKTPTPTRAYIHIERGDRSGYESVVRAMADEEARQGILAQAFVELQQWRRRYKELEELAEIFGAMDRAEETLAPE